MTHRDEEPVYNPVYLALLWAVLMVAGCVSLIFAVYCEINDSPFYAVAFGIAFALLGFIAYGVASLQHRAQR